MITLQHPEQDTEHGKTEDATLSDPEEAASKTNISESRMNGMDEESMDDSTQNLSFRRSKLVILSDDEDDASPRATVTSDTVENEGSFSQRKMRIIGSDSETEDDSFLFRKKPGEGKSSVTSNVVEDEDSIGQKMRVVGSDSENEDDSFLFKTKPDPGKPKVSYNPDIFDTELSDEDRPPVNKAKQAEQELKEIRSESQRMVRESRISLPYHRPKQRTLAEFLARSLEEQKKQVEEFYKSDSDSEDHDDLDWTPENPEEKIVPTEAEKKPDSEEPVTDAALQAKIREKREIQRQKRVQEKHFMETEEIPEDYQNDELPNEEAELTDQSETDYETESEPEENDIPIVDKKREKSAYVDDEAEEEDEEEGDLEPEANDFDDATSLVSDGDVANDASEAIAERRRIIKVADDDSEDEDVGNLTLNWDATQELESDSHPMSRSNTDDLSSLVCKRGETLDKDTSTTSFDSSFELYGSVIAGHQPGGGMKSNVENGLPLSLTKNKSNSFTSTLSCSSKAVAEPLCEDISPTQEMSELLGLCSGGFSGPKEGQNGQLKNTQGAPKTLPVSQDDPDDDELLGLCTAKFTTYV
ncbi:Claspin [Portunus trituberculatus]|uniref:Claspin n=1 Tax=Portunus trituberculatus TaxID=210409 RepID=A0A5B7CG80_PORTR|nr:Claspin [Portunus trituberculatus]